jgi:hypothetical protein
MWKISMNTLKTANVKVIFRKMELFSVQYVIDMIYAKKRMYNLLLNIRQWCIIKTRKD